MKINKKATKIATIGKYRIYEDPIEGDESPMILTDRAGSILAQDMWEVSDYKDRIERQKY